MLPTASIYATLILPQTGSADAKIAMQAAVRILARDDARSDGAPFRLPHRGAVHGARFAVRIRETADEYGPSIVIAVSDRQGDDAEAAATLLRAIVLDALRACPADIIEWGGPGAFIPRDEFIALGAYVSPRRTQEDPDTARDVLILENPRRAAAELRAPWSALRAQMSELRLNAAAFAATVALPATALVGAMGQARG